MVNCDLINSEPRAKALKAIDELKTLVTAHEQLGEVLAVFRDDLAVYKEIAKADFPPFWGRAIVRSVFAGIEGLCYRYKQVALAAAALKNIDLTSAEMAMLREEAYGLNDKGEAESTKSKLRTAPNVVFSLKMLARARGGSYEIDTNCTGWQAFKTSMRVRDRITHPKDASDLQVTEEEAETILTAAIWFLDEERAISEAPPIPATPAAPGG